MRFTMMLCLIALSLQAQGEAYRWVDSATGRTVISDTPPPRSAKDIKKTSDLTSNPEGLTFAVRKAVENFPITLYTSADCLAECKNARDLLNGRGAPFTEKMVQSAEDQEALKKLVGDLFIPSLKIGQQTMRGFEPTGYNNLLDLAGYPKTAPLGSKPSGGVQPAAKGEKTQ
jgi:glutaredoxin